MKKHFKKLERDFNEMNFRRIYQDIVFERAQIFLEKLYQESEKMNGFVYVKMTDISKNIKIFLENQK